LRRAYYLLIIVSTVTLSRIVWLSGCVCQWWYKTFEVYKLEIVESGMLLSPWLFSYLGTIYFATFPQICTYQPLPAGIF
jgi:hypothetical protein